MVILGIFQTSIFRVSKTAKIAIFQNFSAARALAQRAEFCFSDLKRKIVTKKLQKSYKMVTPEKVTKWLQNSYNLVTKKIVTKWLQKNYNLVTKK